MTTRVQQLRSNIVSQDGLFMIAFAEAQGAIEWSVLLQLALLRWAFFFYSEFPCYSFSSILSFNAIVEHWKYMQAWEVVSTAYIMSSSHFSTITWLLQDSDIRRFNWCEKTAICSFPSSHERCWVADVATAQAWCKRQHALPQGGLGTSSRTSWHHSWSEVHDFWSAAQERTDG